MHPTRLFGLIGYPLGHSFSARYFTDKFASEGITDAAYQLFSLEKIDQLPDLLAQNPHLKGLNVTIPHKKTVLLHLDYLTPEAEQIGAVNAIAVTHEGLIGHNTDVYGFEHSLMPWLIETRAQPQSALVLGTGGAAAAVVYFLRRIGMPYAVASREPKNGAITYARANEILAAHQPCLVIQTTPVGMAPHIHEAPPIDLSLLCDRHFVYDLIYNPAETLLLQRASAQGAATTNGLHMLTLQAEAAWQFWNQPSPPIR